MKHQACDAKDDDGTGPELSLSGEGLVELLQGVLSRGALFRFRATGFSMSPLIRDGDVLTLRAPDRESPGRGEVVAFVHPTLDKLVVHRVVARRGNCCITRGDNTFEDDGLVPNRNILARVTNVERRGRRVSLGLGVERHVIAFLAARGYFHRLLCLAGWFARLCSGRPHP